MVVPRGRTKGHARMTCPDLHHLLSLVRSCLAATNSTFKFITIYGILCLSRKEAPLWPVYGSLTCCPAPQRFWMVTSLTLDEFQAGLSPALRGRLPGAYGRVAP